MRTLEGGSLQGPDLREESRMSIDELKQIAVLRIRAYGAKRLKWTRRAFTRGLPLHLSFDEVSVLWRQAKVEAGV
jgi:hypothetical protein